MSVTSSWPAKRPNNGLCCFALSVSGPRRGGFSAIQSWPSSSHRTASRPFPGLPADGLSLISRMRVPSGEKTLTRRLPKSRVASSP